MAANDQQNRAMMEQAPSFVRSESRYGDFPEISYPELQEQKQRQARRQQNSMLNDDKDESQMMESDYSHRVDEQELLEENDQILDLEEVFQDEFSTLRLKQLITSILAEFKTQNQNLTLKDEELQHFNQINILSKNPLLQLEIFNKKKELNNYQVLGSNAEDLRMQIVYTYQQQQEEMEQDQERLLNQFDPLAYPRQVIDGFYGIDYPLNKYHSVLAHV